MSRIAKRILVADDEETIRRLLDYNLRKFDFEPVLAANGREAIAPARGLARNSPLARSPAAATAA